MVWWCVSEDKDFCKPLRMLASTSHRLWNLSPTEPLRLWQVLPSWVLLPRDEQVL